MTFSLLGMDTQTGKPVYIAKASRLQGLYIIGIQGTGKSGLIENLIMQDMKQQIGVCVLDPHGELTEHVLARLPDKETEEKVIYLDLNLVSNGYSFGLNLFACADPTNDDEIVKTLSQVLHVFEKTYGISQTTPLMYDLLYKIAYVLIANPGYTMVDIPLFLTSEPFRKKLVANVKHAEVCTFWENWDDPKQRSFHDKQQENSQTILNKLNDFSHAPLRSIVGQSTTTIDLQDIMNGGKILLVKLNRRLENPSSLVGSIIISQLLNAAFDRPSNKKRQFHLYADEFQRFATEDFATLLEEARKYGIGITMAHQNRAQLLSKNERLETHLKDRTLSAANIVCFRVTGPDGQELASSFDCTPPPAEAKREEKLTPVSNPVDVLLTGKTHPSPVVNAWVKHWKLDLFANTSFVPASYFDDFLWATLTQQGGFIALLNTCVYEAVRTKSPRNGLSLLLFETIVRRVGFGFFDGDQFTKWLLDIKLFYGLRSGEFGQPATKRQKPRDLTLDTLLFSYSEESEKNKREQEIDFSEHRQYRFCPRDYCSFLFTGYYALEKRIPPFGLQEQTVYASLWEAEDETQLQDAFASYEQLVRKNLWEYMEKEVAMYVTFLEQFSFSPNFSISEQAEPVFFELLRVWKALPLSETQGKQIPDCRKIDSYFFLHPNDPANPHCRSSPNEIDSIPEVIRTLGVGFLAETIDFEALVYQEYSYLVHETIERFAWRIIPGQIEPLIMPVLYEEIDRIVAVQKSHFEAFIREFRDVLRILIDEPIAEGSGIYEYIPGVPRTYADVQLERANMLSGFSNFHAHVKLGTNLPQNPGKICQNCGQGNIAGTKDCRWCGTKLPAPNEYSITTLKPTGYIGATAIQQRIASIHYRNFTEGYIRPRKEVEEEIMKRQQGNKQEPGAKEQQGNEPGAKKQAGSPPPRRRKIDPDEEKKTTCKHCGTLNDLDAKFCKECGKKPT